jgi:GT2 family glycosyltransferase
MKLSVIIVNYNVRHFLEQALYSVLKSGSGVDMEVFVVDNNSVDNSVEMVRELFPSVKVIANKENLGFSKANNQAIRESAGEYVLLLNPDTVLQEDTLKKCCDFMDAHLDCGGLGVRMIDGKGKFLPESKRGLPTPAVALFKMTGLSAIFPKSRVFGKYHLKYLPETETHAVDVLSGAFMMLRKETLDKVGLLDEAFFMYGEDIDLSYRITLGGYLNYYFPGTTIIHYKGESTKKKSANYVKVFYNAMVLFARKHYNHNMAGWFAFFIAIAVRLRAILALLWRFLSALVMPLLDFAAVYAGYFLIARYWEIYNKYVRGFYPEEYYWLHIPAYVLALLLAVFISGGYDRPYLMRRVTRGAFFGAVVVFAAYAFLPKNMQFSRAILGLGSAWAMLALPLVRIVLQAIKTGKFDLEDRRGQRIMVVSGEKESRRIQELLAQSSVYYDFIGFVSPDENKPEGFLGNLKQITEVSDIFQINQVIFSAKDVPGASIMEAMSALSGADINFKIVPENSLVIIGSNSKNAPGEMYTIDIQFGIAQRQMQRKKRTLDLTCALLLWLLLPVTVLFQSGRKMLRFSGGIFLGKHTWVSYQGLPGSKGLPAMKPGLFHPSQAFNKPEQEANSNLAYARDYSVQKDLNILAKQFFA